MKAEKNQFIPKEFIHIEFIQDKSIKKKKIKKILSEPSNKECFDCGQKNPEYISLNNGIFICKICALIHQQFPEEISSIKQNINSLTDKELLTLFKGGNKKLLNFVTYEYPGLQNYSTEILYKTKAMEYYRERLKYFSGIGEKPFKPNDLLAYKLIDEEPNNIEKFRRHNNNLKKFLNFFANKNLNDIGENYTKTNSRVNTDLGINDNLKLSCNFNNCSNSINVLDKNLYVKKRNTDNFNKPVLYKKNLITNFKINNTFDEIEKEDRPLRNSYASPVHFSSPKKVLFSNTWTKNNTIDYSNEEKEPDLCKNEFEDNKNFKCNPSKKLNESHEIKIEEYNIYVKPKLKNLKNIYNNKYEGKEVHTIYTLNSSSYNEINFPNFFKNGCIFRKHKVNKSHLNNYENELSRNINNTNIKIKKQSSDYNFKFDESNTMKNNIYNSEKTPKKLFYSRSMNGNYYFSLKNTNNKPNCNLLDQ